MGTDLSNSLSADERRDFEKLKAEMVSLQSDWVLRAKEIRDRKLYREDFKTWDDFCKAQTEMSKRHVDRLIQAREVAANLGHICPKNTPSSQLPVTVLEQAAKADDPAEAIEKATEKAKAEGREKPTAADVRSVVEDSAAYQDDAEYEEDDPAEAAREQMKADNRLLREWQGRVRAVQDAMRSLAKDYPQIDDMPPHFTSEQYEATEAVFAMCGQYAQELDAAHGMLGTAKGADICPLCDGAGCVTCLQSGYLPGPLWDAAERQRRLREASA